MPKDPDSEKPAKDAKPQKKSADTAAVGSESAREGSGSAARRQAAPPRAPEIVDDELDEPASPAPRRVRPQKAKRAAQLPADDPLAQEDLDLGDDDEPDDFADDEDDADDDEPAADVKVSRAAPKKVHAATAPVAKVPLPRDEEALDAPNKQTLWMLGAVAAATLLMWGFSRAACNHSPPIENRSPRIVSTQDLASTAKDGAIEFQQRFATRDFERAAELARGPLLEQVKQAQAKCAADPSCKVKQQSLATTVLTVGELLTRGTTTATVRVTVHNGEQGTERNLLEMERDGNVWKATALTPAPAATPKATGSATPSAGGAPGAAPSSSVMPAGSAATSVAPATSGAAAAPAGAASVRAPSSAASGSPAPK